MGVNMYFCLAMLQENEAPERQFPVPGIHAPAHKLVDSFSMATTEPSTTETTRTESSTTKSTVTESSITTELITTEFIADSHSESDYEFASESPGSPSTYDGFKDVDSLRKAFEAYYKNFKTTKTAQKLFSWAPQTTPRIENIVIMGLGSFTGKPDRFEQLAMVLYTKEILIAQRLTEAPIKIFASDPAHSSQPDEKFLTDLGVQIVKPKPGAHFGVPAVFEDVNLRNDHPDDSPTEGDEDFIERDVNAWFANSDVSAIAAHITPNTFFFGPYLPFEPNLRVLVGKQPTFIIGHALWFLDKEINKYIRDIVPRYPDYEDQFLADKEVVTRIRKGYIPRKFDTDFGEFFAYMRDPVKNRA